MALYDNAYSRAIAWLKIVLPLLALGILSTIFLVSRTIEPSQTLPYADVDAKEFVREQRIGSPNYSGVAANGAAITLTADSARPELDNPDIINATRLDARIRQTDGSVLDIAAEAGIFDSDAGNAALNGGVKMVSSRGYTLTTDRMLAHLDGTEMETETPVLIDGPQLRIEAGQMQMRLKSPKDGPRGYVVVFKDGVKLVYTPEQPPTGQP